MNRFADEGTAPEGAGVQAPQGEDRERSAGALPPFTDPAHSPKPAGSPVRAGAVAYDPPPKDTEYAGHPDFAQDAAANKPPKNFGNSEPADEVEAETRHSEGVDSREASTGNRRS